MTDHTVIAILVGVIALLAAAIGYGLGEHRTTLEKIAEHDHAIEENRTRLRAQSALIQVVAEDYDPPPPTQAAEQQRRRKLPEGWAVIEGEGALAVIALLGNRFRGHWRSVAAAATAAGAVALVGVALLTHGSPPPRHPAIGPPASSTSSTAYSSPSATPGAPTTKPGHTPRRTLPPSLVPPVRRRSPQPAPSPARSSPPPRPLPSQSPSRRPPPPKPRPSPSTCPVGVAVQLPGVGVTVCV